MRRSVPTRRRTYSTSTRSTGRRRRHAIRHLFGTGKVGGTDEATRGTVVFRIVPGWPLDPRPAPVIGTQRSTSDSSPSSIPERVMRRSPVGSGSVSMAVLLAALAACSGSGTSASPSVGPTPASNQPAQGGRGGRGSVIDTTRFVRTSPPSDPIIRDMWQEGINHSQTMALSQVLFDSIGPRLTNSDRYNAGQDWLVSWRPSTCSK